MSEDQLKVSAARIKLLLTDVDGVLTDNGVYYSENGEAMKRFSIRDGMGVERLRKLAGIDTGIITGETSPSVVRRAEKLQIRELHLGIRNKLDRVTEIMQRLQLQWQEIAYIGDDVNDLEVMEKAGLTACPADAMPQVSEIVRYHCRNEGGYGAFREFAEWLIELKK
ncbi:HAD-IIIA family hydrolase [Flavitalea sp. BT771]|uniref:KdsC family phosphatase n=1 Tax=Flavitalea sp. BT771 TaxID=3063329 RepID=UPI0026E3A185|nr:HAD-IIIA family hydrolase [Flavitalea sp. BT771]MDO6432502.1 HAD-IIIA family hydrolase [Flavitalea sp. BT771]MDV6221411.1 HAD-IIIA family hydrolase [Flavitalea sp. BT771]